MPAIVDILDHFGSFDVGTDEWRIDTVVDGSKRISAGGVYLADHCLWRLPEVLNRGAFAQELGIVADAEILASLLSGGFFEDRNHDITHGSGQDRTADDDSMARALMA